MLEKFIIEVYGCEADLYNGANPVEVIVCDDSVKCQAEQLTLEATMPESCVFTVSRRYCNE